MDSQQRIATRPDALARPRPRTSEASFERHPGSPETDDHPAYFLLGCGNIRAFSTDRKSAIPRRISTTVISVGTAAIRFFRLAATVETLTARTTS
jgi:hypothetical protein